MAEFADRLSTALQRLLMMIVPTGFDVSAAHGVVTVRRRGKSSLSASTHVAEILGHHEEREGAQISALQSLSTVQDFISEALSEAWPSDPSRGRSYMGLPQARLEGNRLHLWFGEPTHVTLDVGVIELLAGVDERP